MPLRIHQTACKTVKNNRAKIQQKMSPTWVSLPSEEDERPSRALSRLMEFRSHQGCGPDKSGAELEP